MSQTQIPTALLLRQLLLLLICHLIITPTASGKWDLLISNVGISAMHMQLLNNDRVVLFDRTDFGKSNISLPDGKCRNDPNDTALKTDCTAHSVEYNIVTNTIRPLTILTDTWCSSGSLMSDGELIQTGGYNDGERVVRVFQPCNNNNCDWEEIKFGLNKSRWYASNLLLPDGRQIIVGGINQFNYEFYPKTGSDSGAFYLAFLNETDDRSVPSNFANNLYPFVFLNVDGNLFIFANNRAILFNYVNGTVVKRYPEITGGDPRNYPTTGSAVLLPLKNLEAPEVVAEVMVCGGAPKGAYGEAINNIFVGALDTCGRIKITDPEPQWVMETMPLARVMGEMILLPNGDVLIINGAANGSAGWECGRNPVLAPVIYRPNNQNGSRFEIQNSTTIPRMYHSTAILVRDGRVLVGGSNPHHYYNFTGVLYPTELRLEAFSPSYLDPGYVNLRPNITLPVLQTKIGYGQRVTVQFTVSGTVNGNLVSVTMVAPSFNTHSFSMNQRLLMLGGGNVTTVGKGTYELEVVTPGSGNFAPSGYYLLFVVHQEIPSEGIWVQIQ